MIVLLNKTNLEQRLTSFSKLTLNFHNFDLETKITVLHKYLDKFNSRTTAT